MEGPATVTVWDDTVPAGDMGALVAQWFSDFLGQPCRLVCVLTAAHLAFQQKVDG